MTDRDKQTRDRDEKKGPEGNKSPKPGSSDREAPHGPSRDTQGKGNAGGHSGERSHLDELGAPSKSKKSDRSDSDDEEDDA